MNILKIFGVINRFYTLKTQFEQIKRGDFQLPPLVISFINDTEIFFEETKDVLKDLQPKK